MSLFGLFDRRANPLERPQHALTSQSLLDWLGIGPTNAGVEVTPDNALTASAVYRAVSLISGLGGALPIHTYRNGTSESVGASIVDDPHPDLTPFEFWRLTYLHRLLWGNFVAQKVRNGAGTLQWLHPLNPSSVAIGKARPIEANPSGKVFEVTQEDGSRVVLTPRDIFHLPALGYDGVTGLSLVQLAAQSIGMSLAAETHGARLFGSGNLLSGILKTPQRLEQAQAERLQNRWRQKMGGLQSSHEVAVLDAGAEFQSLTMPNDDAQLLEMRAFQVAEFSRFSGVPLFLMMETEKSTSWGTGLEQQALGFVQFDLHPQYLAPTEQRITKDLLKGSGRYAKYSVEGLLRGDSKARAEFYTAMRNLGAYSANDIRALEDMTPIAAADGGDLLIVPMNMTRLDRVGQDTQPTDTPGDQTGDETEGGSDAAPQPSE